MLERTQICSLIEQGAIELFGQPKWTFGKNTCNTYEVFAERVHLPGGDIIPARELLEVIVKDEALTEQYSQWFMPAAMQSAVDLSYKADANVTLSINILPLRANREDFIPFIRDSLHATGLRPYKLHLEISQAQELTKAGVEALNILHDEDGIGLALSNFGTGYANIDLLREVHFDSLEIARAYASGVPENEQVCRLLIAIAHFADTMNLSLCAKGIENADQLEFFEHIGCLKGQGFLIGAPMTMDELRDYIIKYAKKRSK